MTTRDFRDRLQRRARKAGVSVAPDVAEALEAYFRLLTLWNQKINLTALPLTGSSDEAIDRLLIEPLVAAKHLPNVAAKMIDIGSGGGSPALPMRIAVPDSTVLMVESKTRKTVFLREVVRTLGLERADVVTARFEELLTRPELHEAFDALTLRAVRTELRVLLGLQAFVRPGGTLLLFRGGSRTDSVESVTPPLAWRATFPLIESSGRLVLLEKLRVGKSQPVFHVEQSRRRSPSE